MRKIGIMGGTFDPIHNGHLILAKRAEEQLGLDEVRFVPAGLPPHKLDRHPGAGPEERLAMVRLATAAESLFTVSEYELKKTTLSYTWETLTAFHETEEGDFHLIIGGDSLKQFRNWREPQIISDLATLCATVRDEVGKSEAEEIANSLREEFGTRVVLIDMPNIEISSTMIRERVREGLSVRYYVPDAVADYITENDLYGRS